MIKELFSVWPFQKCWQRIMVEANITNSVNLSEEINICVRVVPILLHLIGLYTLHCLRKRRLAIHLKLIQHLSISELALLLVGLLISVLNLALKESSPRRNEAVLVLVLMKNTGLSLVYYFMNIFITLDRLAEMKFHIKYPQYITHSMVNAILTILWLCALLFTILVVYHCLDNPDFDHVKFVYFYFFSIMEAVFLVIALVTYSYILKQYIRLKTTIGHHETPKTGEKCEIRSQSQPQWLQRRKSIAPKLHKLKHLFSKRSPLLMISLLVLTFIFFMVLPDAINLHYYVSREQQHVDENLPRVIVVLTYILYTLAYTSDGLIYVFLQRDARKILVKKLTCRQRQIVSSISMWTTRK